MVIIDVSEDRENYHGVDVVEPEDEKIIKEKVVRKGHGYQPIDEAWDEDIGEIYEQVKAGFGKRTNIVKECLSWMPCRDNDRFLDLEALRTEFPEIKVTSSKENLIYKIPKKLLKFLPSPESYSRIRRKLNEKGEFLSENPNVIERRKKREKAYRKFFQKRKI